MKKRELIETLKKHVENLKEEPKSYFLYIAGEEKAGVIAEINSDDETQILKEIAKSTAKEIGYEKAMKWVNSQALIMKNRICKLAAENGNAQEALDTFIEFLGDLSKDE